MRDSLNLGFPETWTGEGFWPSAIPSNSGVVLQPPRHKGRPLSPLWQSWHLGTYNRRWVPAEFCIRRWWACHNPYQFLPQWTWQHILNKNTFWWPRCYYARLYLWCEALVVQGFYSYTRLVRERAQYHYCTGFYWPFRNDIFLQMVFCWSNQMV